MGHTQLDPKMTWILWQSCLIDPLKQDEVVKDARFILDNQSRYKLVGDALAVPFYIVGLIHMREGGFSFRTHLANGDPLWNSDGVALATRHVPVGLGPFKSWEDAAIAALNQVHWTGSHRWDIVNALYSLEAYNGLGYRKFHSELSPYIWSYTNHMECGKYRDDGVFDPLLMDKEPGCAAVLVALKALGVDLNEIPPVT